MLVGTASDSGLAWSAMTLAVHMLLQHCTDQLCQSVARDYRRGLFVGNVQAATNAALAVDEFAAVLGGHACAEPDGALALDAADAVWIVHRKPLPIVTKNAASRPTLRNTNQILGIWVEMIGGRLGVG